MRTATPYALSQPQPPQFSSAGKPSPLTTPSSAGPAPIMNLNGNQLDREIQVLIATPYGRTVPVFIRLSDTVRTLKSKIQDKENVPVDRQSLVFGGSQLVDGNTLAQYRIPSMSTIQLSMPSRGVKIENMCTY
ncbi:ubiquitin-related domain-containing protein [Daedaleopsis nitida]|nr:ubiquitin-related domain-containing protein [Daedaleopsis nitida]